MADSFDRPWVEKYRPQILDDVVGKKNKFLKIFTKKGNKEIISQLREIAEKGNVPNLIIVVNYFFLFFRVLQVVEKPQV